MERIARDKGCTPAQLALAWLLSRGPEIVPIPGSTRIERVAENAGAVKITLTPEEIAALDTLGPTVVGDRYTEGGMRSGQPLTPARWPSAASGGGHLEEIRTPLSRCAGAGDSVQGGRSSSPRGHTMPKRSRTGSTRQIRSPQRRITTPGTSEAAVTEATGRKRSSWFTLLDRWGAAERSHRDIAAWLRREHSVDNWWAQTLTVDYERRTRTAASRRPSRRHVHGQREQDVECTRRPHVRRVPQSETTPALAAGRRHAGTDLSTGTHRQVRLEDGATRVMVDFVAKGTARSQVALTHERLASAGAAAKSRAYWRERIVALQELLER